MKREEEEKKKHSLTHIKNILYKYHRNIGTKKKNSLDNSN